MYKNILVPTDGSPLSLAAARQAVSFAREIGAKVVFLTVTEPFHIFSTGLDQLEGSLDSYRQEAQARAARTLAEAAKTAEAMAVPVDLVQVEDEHPFQAIIDTAEEKGCDLITMASHGRRGVSALLLGSETIKVLTHSKLPVLVYR